MAEPLSRAAHGALYSMLSRLFLLELDRGLLAALSRPEIADVLDKLAPGCAAYLRDTDWTDAALDDVAAEYARLFVLPNGVAPYAASWGEGDPGILRAQLADRINLLFDILKVRPVDFGVGNVPADHIGILLALCAVAAERESGDATSGLLVQARALLLPWGRSFAERMAAMTEDPLYRATALLLATMLDDS